MQHASNTTTSESIHKQIRLARRALELSQLEVALHIGISQSQYSLFEKGHVNLTSELIDRITSYLNGEDK
jgi:transcriptional regulator with XRE-family HTH domain